MPKRVVLCFDGTWNTPGDHADLSKVAPGDPGDDDSFDATKPETNACRMFRSVPRVRPGDPGGEEQVKWYDKGVGTHWYDHVGGGAFGLGLSRKIREGYKWLSDTYDDGDHAFVFGFSRGAYTARSLVGLIRNCGLLPRGSLTELDPDANSTLMEAYGIYRTRDEGADSERAQTFRATRESRVIPIKFLGVWDTVGALGVPIGSFDTFNKALFEFHDTELSSAVENAFHAVAIDEHRAPYGATLWEPAGKLTQTVEQRWFVGAHADVGGGYEDRRLSDITLKWMQEKAQACGLHLNLTDIPQVTPENRDGSIADSFRAFLGGSFSLFHKRHFRPIGATHFGQECVDPTACDRYAADVAYRPKNTGFRQLAFGQGQ